MALYFAYGSNLSREQMRERCPSARPVERARIPDHRLGFVGHSEAWGGGTSTIVLAPGETLWGALYEVDDACLEELGRREGSAYTLSRTPCLTDSGERKLAHLFVRSREFDFRPPSDRYVERIRQGFADWELDPAALDRVVDRARRTDVHSRS